MVKIKFDSPEYPFFPKREIREKIDALTSEQLRLVVYYFAGYSGGEAMVIDGILWAKGQTE